MGKMIEHPRYNIVCTRLSDADYFALVEALRGRSMAEYLQQAISEKLIRDGQVAMDEFLRAQGV